MKYLSSSLVILFILTGCASKEEPKPIVEVITEDNNITEFTVPQNSKKKIKLKKVQDNNFNDAYMYPTQKNTTKQNKPEVVQEEIKTTNSSMGKEECISMISQEKFDKYSSMFGSEAASIKRCAMLKEMNNS